ncbi:transcriptional regulator [Paenibacillus swuensis]|uniref:Transcriptional regulator n=1 Tax=Paenibacillus swuensis TaxID=1178515 RepID=A0A172TES7_9BACL|nr:GntR family transcriptional regulator [Paenibacillus swuensis]ANE45541.1 transcriptional regulator [Paenibacillus swuensis]
MRIPIQLKEDSPEPLYHQIEVQLRGLIINGQLPEGTLLPSIREFAQELSCSVITIRRVYQDLENEGLLRTKQGTGTFVSKIETGNLDKFRLKEVTEALEAAVDTGIRAQYRANELKKLFMHVLENKYGKGAGQDE